MVNNYLLIKLQNKKIKIHLIYKDYFSFQRSPKVNRHGMRSLQNHEPRKTINLPKPS